MDWTYELGICITPTHALGYRQPVKGLLCDSGQQFGGRFSLLLDLIHQPLALVRLHSIELVCCRATRAGKSLRSFGWIAMVIKGGLDRGSTALNLTVRLLQSAILNQQCQAARCGVGFNGSVLQICLFKTGNKCLGQRTGELFESDWWQLFSSQFEQQISRIRHWPPPSPASAWGSQVFHGPHNRLGQQLGIGLAPAGYSADAQLQRLRVGHRAD